MRDGVVTGVAGAARVLAGVLGTSSSSSESGIMIRTFLLLQKRQPVNKCCVKVTYFEPNVNLAIAPSKPSESR